MNLKPIQYSPLILFSAFGLCASSQALSADIGNQGIDNARFENSPISDWQGLYAGVNFGVIGGGGDINKGAGNGNFELGQGRLGLGGHLGYNFNPVLPGASGAWLFGGELDISSAGLKSKKNDPILGDVELSASFVGSTRLRGGYAWDRFYLYGTAGLAVSDFAVKPSDDNKKEIRLGSVIGLGGELKLRDQWSMRAEALAYDFGGKDYVFSGTKRSTQQGMVSFRLGLSRKF